MNKSGWDGGDGAYPPGQPLSTRVLADRIAATLVHHEPGWRLPRLTALARRYHVSTAEIDAAIGDLVARHLLRRLPDGQVYRASPAEYFLPLEGVSGLTSYVDPMGGRLACRRRQVVRSCPAESISRSLELAPGEPVMTVRCLWTVGGEPGALSATYLPDRFASAQRAPGAPWLAAGEDGDDDGDTHDPCPCPAGASPGQALSQESVGSGRPRALQVEMAPPPPSVARSLRLSAGDMVTTVTVTFEEPASHSPAALTVAMLRPELFRIVMRTTASAAPEADVDGFATAWTRADAGWEP